MKKREFTLENSRIEIWDDRAAVGENEKRQVLERLAGFRVSMSYQKLDKRGCQPGGGT